VPAGEFARGLSKTVTVNDFPSSGKSTTLVWQESLQNFAIAGVSGGNPSRNVQVDYGCYSNTYQGVAPQAIGCGILPSFGDANFDLRFGQETQIQASFWTGFPATVYPFDECPGVRNALSRPDHVILFGRNITVDTILSTGSDLPVAGILAHEWGHQVQFGYGWMNQAAPSVRSSELEADAFSGYYMGLVKRWAGPELNTYFQRLFSLGDYQFNDPGHHGTPNERVAAGALGMQAAANAIYNNTPYNYEQLHQIFTASIGTAILKERTPVTKGEPSIAVSAIDLEYIRKIASGEASAEWLRMPSASDEQRRMLYPNRAVDR